MQETWVWSLGQEGPLEKGMAIHSSVFAWKIPWTEECGGLQSMGSQSRPWLSTHTHVSPMIAYQQGAEACAPLCWLPW